MRDFHKPVRRPGDILEALHGSGDPAELGGLAHDTAAALLDRVRSAGDRHVVDRVIAYADEHGIDDVAELWADSPATTLPGSMWRVYVLRHAVAANPQDAGYLFKRGVEVDGVNHAIAGGVSAPSPEEVVELATRILRGAFEGDYAVALERAAAFSRVLAAGADQLDDVKAGSQPSDNAAKYRALATELTAGAQAWRQNVA